MRDSLYIGTALLLLVQSAAWAHSPERGIRKCAAITDDSDRLRCFDALAAETASESPAAPGSTVAADPPAAPEPTADPPASSDPVDAAPVVAASAGAAADLEPVSDDFGSERIRERQDRSEPEQYAATVTRCEQSKQSGQYYFYFENGQVWKQSNYKKLRWRDCEFGVTVSKGTFGYEMYVPEDDKTVRVKRVQ